jgi:CTP synthase
MQKKCKYIFVTGGVISGLGKGIITASTGLILQNLGFKISVLKADMYLNLDAGTMNPLEHGEVFVTEDARETDQDLGHYERFLNKNVLKHNYITMGKIYYDVITNERQLEYGGKCVEGNVHIPAEIIRRIKETATKDEADVLLIEVGGTVGEYQNIMFYEAIRKLKLLEPENVFIIHLVYLPIPEFLGEMKSKPAQTSIYELYKLGLQPNFIVCRSAVEIDEKRKSTMSINTGIRKEFIFAAPDVDTIYKIPETLKSQNFPKILLKAIDLKPKQRENKSWAKFISNLDKTKRKKNSVTIAICGKYYSSGKFSLEDSYVCVLEAIKHASWKLNLNPIIRWFNVEDMDIPEKRKAMEAELLKCGGIVVPQGWGFRGVEGKIKVIELARKFKIPYFGLCFGMQMAVIEFSRNVLGLNGANSEEADPKTNNPVIHIMPNQVEYLKSKNYGGTIRLGAWPCILKKGSIAYEAYNKYPNKNLYLKEDNIIMERHRHRYEFNNNYRELLENAGLVISGTSTDGSLVEIVELPQNLHPFFVGTQFHPEYKSRPLEPHPLFLEFISKSKKSFRKNSRQKAN